MTRTILFPVLAASLIAGSAAIAAEPSGKDGAAMQRLDADGDGAISLEEFSGPRLAAWADADADGDGTLSQQELKDHALKREADRRLRRMTRRLDVDGDGTVTLAELEARQKKRFALMDVNDDGKLDAGEMRHGLRRIAAVRGHLGNGPGRQGMRGEGRGWGDDPRLAPGREAPYR